MSNCNKTTAQALVKSVTHLLSLPEVYMRLEAILKSPSHTRRDVAEIVNTDPVLCARVLRIVNSSYYGLPNHVNNIAMAVNLIGEYDLRNLVLVASVANSVAALVDGSVDIKKFWKHSIRCGIGARLLAQKVKVEDPELMFLCGLLHDLGKLIIYQGEAELSSTVSCKIKGNEMKQYQVEQELMGFNHAVVGSILTESWNLPTQLNEIIRFHHQPDDAIRYKVETHLIEFSDHLAHFTQGCNCSVDLDMEQLTEKINFYQSVFNVDTDSLTTLLTDLLEQSAVIEGLVTNVK